MNSTMQIRIDRATKAQAQKAFAKEGMGLSSGTRLLLRHIGRTGIVPREIFTYDNAPEALKKKLWTESQRVIRDYKKGKLKGYTDVKQLMRDLLAEK